MAILTSDMNRGLFIFPFLVTILCFYPGKTSSQSKIDSLLQSLAHAKQDTNKVILLHDLCRRYLYNDPAKALHYGMEANQLAEQLHYTKGCSRVLHNIGIIYYNRASYDTALTYFFRSLKLKEILGDKKSIASSLNNIGAVLYDQGKYKSALDYYLRSLGIFEDLKNREGAMSASLNVGNILSELQNFSGAVGYYRQSLTYALELNDAKGKADAYQNIGGIYNDLKQKDSSIFYYRKALLFYKQAEFSEGLAISYNVLGQWYKNNGLTDSALAYYQRALDINLSTNNRDGLSTNYNNLGMLYLSKKDYATASGFYTKGLTIARETGNRDFIASYCKSLSELYEAKHDYLNAYLYHKTYSEIKDSLIHTETSKQITEMQTRFETGKKEQEIGLLNKDKQIQEQDIRKQKIFTLFVAGGLLTSTLLLSFIFRSLKITRRQKAIIEVQKQQNEEKSKILEEKNRDIIDSINYARRIQDALLKEENHVSEHLPEHFILFKPKDIVSGDFYWAAEKTGISLPEQGMRRFWYIAAVDCTGHGVPGAFMSMLGVAFLNEIISGSSPLAPAEILNQLSHKIMKELNQTGSYGENKDGMDISLARLDLDSGELQWAGANNPLWIIPGKEAALSPPETFEKKELVREVRADKQPIGFHTHISPFTNHALSLEKGSVFFLFSDGIADQFGGPAGKKFKYSKLKKLLLEIRHEPLSRQKELLNSAFETWKGELEQVDDVCMIGVRI
jgi:serine phosphatase RsbU (regulator of sigma subunit)/Tfp pilus assembly protein PilF